MNPASPSAFVMTQKPLEEGEEEAEIEAEDTSKRSEMSHSFKFDWEGSTQSNPWDFDVVRKKYNVPRPGDELSTTVEEKINLLKRKRGDFDNDDSDNDEGGDNSDDNESENGSEDESESESDSNSDSDSGAANKKEVLKLNENTRDYRKFKEKRKKVNPYFSEMPEIPKSALNTFEAVNVSRPILKAISDLGWDEPTPIQQQVIPIALAGRDIAASAATGSGKTAAFVIPILERLLFKDVHLPVTRVLILLPTRELAAQCHSVILKLSKYCNSITVSLVLGGLALAPQIVEVQRCPDIIVATPGRILDHLRNTKSFGLDQLEIMIFDEADRLLELGFTDEVEEIVRQCPRGIHTMLFSATMTEEVSSLMKLSLRKPVRISVDNMNHTARNLVQEFVKIRFGPGHYVDKDAALLALCTRTFKANVLVFFRQKRDAHRMKILFGLAGLNAAELHGNMSQMQRLESLESFRDGKAQFLLATDVASRGLDIMGIKTVINYAMPPNQTIYIHRVGRTARAGATGRSVSFITDSTLDRKLLKDIVKTTQNTNVCKHRVLPSDVFSEWKEKVEKFELDIKEINQHERSEAILQIAERDAIRAQNILTHYDEISNRPQRTWFINEKMKKERKEQVKETLKGQQDVVKVVEEPKPHVKRLPSRREKLLKDDSVTRLTPKDYSYAKKRNKRLSETGQGKKKKQKDKFPPKEPVEEPKFKHKQKKQKGNFKSKKRHKRR